MKSGFFKCLVCLSCLVCLLCWRSHLTFHIYVFCVIIYVYKINTMWILITQRITLDFFWHLVYFPIWWYTLGLKKALFYCFSLLRTGSDLMAPRLWLQNLFVPMFGQSDWQGRIVSVLIRFINVIIRGIGLLIWFLAVILIFLLWLVWPIFILYMLIMSIF